MARDPAPSHHQDSSLPYSQAPAVSVRLLCFGTMKLLRLPIFSHRPSCVGLDGDTLAAAKDDVGSPKFPENPIVPVPCSQTPAEPRRLAFAAPQCCPSHADQKGLDNIAAFGALSHGLGTGCLRFVPPLLATTQNSLPGDGQSFPGGIPMYPLSSIGKFLPLGFPFPWVLLGATAFHCFRVSGPATFNDDHLATSENANPSVNTRLSTRQPLFTPLLRARSRRSTGPGPVNARIQTLPPTLPPLSDFSRYGGTPRYAFQPLPA